jgi:hypothetical protein
LKKPQKKETSTTSEYRFLITPNGLFLFHLQNFEDIHDVHCHRLILYHMSLRPMSNSAASGLHLDHAVYHNSQGGIALDSDIVGLNLLVAMYN